MTAVICFIRNKYIIFTDVDADKGIYRRTGHTVFLSWLNLGHKTNRTTADAVPSVQQEPFCDFTAAVTTAWKIAIFQAAFVLLVL